jgi:hypothetical protein
MQCRVLLTLMIFAAACDGPEIERFEGAWRLTSVNIQPLPATGNATGEVWAAAILQLTGETGVFNRCMEDPSTSTQTTQSSGVLVTPISGDQFKLDYFDRRSGVSDTATLDGTQLTLRYGKLDVLTFVPLAGEVPEVCSLVP